MDEIRPVGHDEDNKSEKPRPVLVLTALNENPCRFLLEDERTHWGRIIGGDIPALKGRLEKASPNMLVPVFELNRGSEGENPVPTLWESKGVKWKMDRRRLSSESPFRFFCAHSTKLTEVGNSNWADEVPCSVEEGRKSPIFSFSNRFLHKTMGEFPAEDDDLDNLEKGVYCRSGDDKQGNRERFFKECRILVNPLFDVNVQGAFALGAYKTSAATSPAKDALLYVLVFVYVLGFISALAGKLFGSSKMGAIGSGAAALGFLLTMVFVLL